MTLVTVLLALGACAQLFFDNPFSGAPDTATAAPKEPPRADFGSTIAGLDGAAAASLVAWRAEPKGDGLIEYAAFRADRSQRVPAATLRVNGPGDRVDTVAARISRQWIDEGQYERYFRELSALFGQALNGRAGDFDLDRWVRNVHLSNGLVSRGAWSFATIEADGVTVSYVLSEGIQAFVATVNPECAADVEKGPEVWRFGPSAGICGGVFPQ